MDRLQFGSTMKWIGRALSIPSILLLAAFAFSGGGVPKPQEALALLFFPGGVVAGMILGWWRARLGGWISLISLAAFYAVMLIFGHQFPTGPYFALFSLPALFLVLGEDQPRSARRLDTQMSSGRRLLR